MPTEEQIIQRRIKFAKQFAAQGASVPQAVKLSGVAETTAQRRGRSYDPLAAVIEQAVAPPPPVMAAAAPPPPNCKPDEMLSGFSCVPRTVPGLACFTLAPKQSIARGIALRGCPGKPGQVYIADYSGEANLTTEKYFADQINANQKALKAAGYKVAPSQSTLSNLQSQLNKANQVAIKQCGKSAYYQNSPACKSARRSRDSIQQMYDDARNAPTGWF